MRRTKLVLAAAAVMVTMLVAFSAPAMADNGNGNNHHNGWDNWNNWNNWDNHNDFNRFNNNDFNRFNNNFNDDCAWEFEEGWFFGFWGWQWGAWFLDC